MTTHTTTIRLPADIKKEITNCAKQLGLSFSDFTKILFRSYIMRDRRVEETHYSKSYLDKLERESKKTMRLYKTGKLKGYSSGTEMMRDILGQ